MKKPLLLSLGTLLFIGVILVPISVFYFKDAMPFMIAASCLAGILAYLYFSDKAKAIDAQISSTGVMTSSLSEIAKHIVTLKEAFSEAQKAEESAKEANSKSINELTEILKNAISVQTNELKQSNEELKSKLNDLQTKCLAELSNTATFLAENQKVIISNQSTSTDILAKIQSVSKENFTEILNQNKTAIDSSKSIATAISQLSTQQDSLIKRLENNLTTCNTGVISSLNQILAAIGEAKSISQQGINEIIHHRDQMVKASTSLYENIERLNDQQDVIASTLGNVEISANNSMNYLEESRSLAIESSKNLSSSIEKFLSDHEGIQMSLNNTTNRIMTLQENLEETISKQADIIEKIMNDFNIEFASNTSKIRKTLDNSTETVTDSLSDSVKKLKEKLQDLIDKVGNFTSNISDNMDLLSEDIKQHDDKLAKLSYYIPKLQDLNTSEEQMMRELEKICRIKR